MWHGGVITAASDAAPANDSLIALVGALGVAAIGALGLVLTEWVRGRNSRTTASPPSPSVDTAKDVTLYERTAVLADRADDADDRDKIQDMELRDQRNVLDEHHARLRKLERHHDINEPEWRES